MKGSARKSSGVSARRLVSDSRIGPSFCITFTQSKSGSKFRKHMRTVTIHAGGQLFVCSQFSETFRQFNQRRCTIQFAQRDAILLRRKVARRGSSIFSNKQESLTRSTVGYGNLFIATACPDAQE